MTNSHANIIHATRSWLPQTQTWLYNQVNSLSRRRFNNHIVCEQTQNLDQFKLPHIHRLRPSNRWAAFLGKKIGWIKLRGKLNQIRALAKKTHANILHSHFGDMGWENSWVTKNQNLKHVVTFYGFDVHRLPCFDPRWYRRYRELFQRVDLVLCEGHFMADSIVNLGCSPEKIRVQHLGVDVANIQFKPRVWKKGQPFRILIAATFVEKKGIPFALEALARIQNEVDLEVTLIGDASPNKPRSLVEKQKILRMIDQLKLKDKIRRLGFIPYVEFFNEAYAHHVFLSPSLTAADGDSEGGAPVSLIDMAASGIPIVSTRHCDIPEVIVDGQTGLLAKEKSVDELVTHLRWLIGNSDQWDKMLSAGRKRIESEYNATLQAEKLADIYRKLLRS